jgi:hypothetical protein
MNVASHLRLARFAFLVSLVALVPAGGIVYGLNFLSLQADAVVLTAAARTDAALAEPDDPADEPPSPAPSPEASADQPSPRAAPSPAARVPHPRTDIRRMALVQTAQQLRLLLAWVAFTGFIWGIDMLIDRRDDPARRPAPEGETDGIA